MNASSSDTASAGTPHRVVAIDGPAASGKSSVARLLARRLGFTYVNTGAMYRAVAWLAVRRGVDPADAGAVAALLGPAALEFGVTGRESSIRADGVDPAPHLCDPAVNASVSAVAAIPEVRRVLVARQREFARDRDIVMEGRDIGSVVFPDTPLKFYIDASPEVRAQRRARQGLQDNLAARDKTDSSRSASPLVVAEGAQVIDSSSLTLEEVVGEILARLEREGIGVAAGSEE